MGLPAVTVAEHFRWLYYIVCKFEFDNDVTAPMEAPQDVRVSFVDYQSVLLEWRGVYTTINEEPLEGYIVRISFFFFLYVNICK